jgi:glycosyltransferase involved in cell wall biosynthesis
MPDLTFSVVICTHNRSALLADTIASVKEQTYPPEFYEIVVVDNASTDKTRQVVQTLQDKIASLRYVYEPRLGKSFACNAGAREASGDVVAYTDDDVVIDHGWLEGLAEGYRFGGPNIGAVGGAIRVLWEGARPSWLPPELEGYLGDTRRLGDKLRVLNYGDGLNGANLSALRSTLTDVGGFPVHLGPSGVSNLARYDEDLAFCQRVWRHGKQIAFVPHALVYHRVSSSRVTRSFFLRRGYAQGASDILMEQASGAWSRGTLVSSLAVGTSRLAQDLVRAASMRIHGRSQDTFAQLVYSASRLGRLCKQSQMFFLGRHSTGAFQLLDGLDRGSGES